MSQYANFLHEVGMLQRTPRSGLQFLGAGTQSVSEHIQRMLHIAFLLARLNEEHVDELKLLHLVLFHDLPEARTSDHNYVNRRYVIEDVEKVLQEGERVWPFGAEIAAYVREFEAAETPEARLAKDADQLELLAMLKEQYDLGNAQAMKWMQAALQRVKTIAGKKIAEEIMQTRWDAWWFSDQSDPHWVEGKKR